MEFWDIVACVGSLNWSFGDSDGELISRIVMLVTLLAGDRSRGCLLNW